MKANTALYYLFAILVACVICFRFVQEIRYRKAKTFIKNSNSDTYKSSDRETDSLLRDRLSTLDYFISILDTVSYIDVPAGEQLNEAEKVWVEFHRYQIDRYAKFLTNGLPTNTWFIKVFNSLKSNIDKVHKLGTYRELSTKHRALLDYLRNTRSGLVPSLH